MTLTAKQEDAMRSLSNYVGKTVLVLTSEYTASISAEAVAKSVDILHHSTIRGLAKKGYIEVVNNMWRGAEVKVLKGTC